MKFVNCPNLGKRALSEFSYGGIVEHEPDYATVTETEWTDHVFYRHSHPQEQKEWWYHRATGMWFFFQRNTLTDVVSKVTIASKGALNDA